MFPFSLFCLFSLLGVRSCTVAACASQLLRACLLAYFAYHAIAWYVVHAVGRVHGGENIAAAVVVFLPQAMLSWASLFCSLPELGWLRCCGSGFCLLRRDVFSALYEKTSACAPARLLWALLRLLCLLWSLGTGTASDGYSQL